MTQRKRSQSETLKDFVLKSQKVSHIPPKQIPFFIVKSLTKNISCLLLPPAGETGLLVGKIGKQSFFTGYAKNKQQTEKKKLKDVFVKGDVYFNSGDLLRIDNEGFVYFQDRIGDTFRSVDQNN